MKTLFELFRRFDARRIFGFIRRLGGMSRPKVKCYDLRSTRALRVEGDGSRFYRPAPYRNFYPRPPGGRRRNLVALQLFSHDFYPHSPGGGRLENSSYTLTAKSHFYPRPPGGGRQQKRTKFSSVFAQKGEEFASLRREKRKICRWRFKKDKFWVLIWCEGSGKSVCALASHCG